MRTRAGRSAGARKELPEEPELRYREGVRLALAFLSSRARTAREVRDRLRRAGLTNDETARVLAELNQWHYLDDEGLAQAHVSAAATGRPRGSVRIGADLRRRGVDGETIDQALAGLPAELEAERAQEAAEAWLRRRARPPDRDELRRLGDHLRRKGFPWDVIAPILARLPAGGNEDDSS